MSFNAVDLVLLLLPLAVLSGWYAARLDQRRRATSKDLPAAYFKGLNFLLNEQPDKAIEVFIQVLEVNSETVETHLALGNLFRRRGEVERAIRVHQNLIARPTLDKAQRSEALLELGQDYLKAGLLDRAENIFLELAEVRLHSEPALRFLMHIYQQEHDWDKAIATCHKLERISGKDLEDIVAQYYCEIAEEHFAKRRNAQAREFVAKALGVDKRCVRASMLLGRIEASEGRHAQAIEAWQHIEAQDPSYLGEVAEPLAASFRARGDLAGLATYLRGALERHGGVALTLATAEAILAHEGADAAETFIAARLRREPSVDGLQRLIGLHLAHAQGDTREDLAMLNSIVDKLSARHRGYLCNQCGFRAKALYWQCPSCHRWKTVRRTGELLD